MRKTRLAALLVVTACHPGTRAQANKLNADLSIVEEDTRSGMPFMYTSHDNKRDVTCWVAVPASNQGAGISCIPDWQLKAPQVK